MVWCSPGLHDDMMLSFYGQALLERIIVVKDRWVTVDEICTYLNVSNETIYKWIDQMGLPAHKVGRRWMFKRDQVDQWVQSGSAALEERRLDSSKEK